MHLNNRGWGTREMIIMTAFLLLMLAISWYYISTLYQGVLVRNAVSIENEHYDLVKNRLVNSAQKYYYDNSLEGPALLSYELLKEKGYISDIQDFIDFSCNGYVTVNNGVFKPYINCKDYISEGYISDYE